MRGAWQIRFASRRQSRNPCVVGAISSARTQAHHWTRAWIRLTGMLETIIEPPTAR